MLTVYMYRVDKPPGAFDLSVVPLDELAEAVSAIVQHHASGHIWLGYIEGWMLSPRDEVILRPALRNFECTCVSFFPLALPHAWKNELDTIYAENLNGAREPDNNGGAVHDAGSAGHEPASVPPAADRPSHQGRKARRNQARNIAEGPDSPSGSGSPA